MPISRHHLTTLLTLPTVHRDPFDHLLIAQTIAEGATLISLDSAMARYAIDILPR